MKFVFDFLKFFSKIPVDKFNLNIYSLVAASKFQNSVNAIDKGKLQVMKISETYLSCFSSNSFIKIWYF